MRPPNDRQHRTDTHYAWGVCGFLIVATGLIYGQTLGHVLLDYDDNFFVFKNPHVTAGLTERGIWWAFTEGPFGEWYPLAALSHMLDCQLFGVQAWGHHLTNVLLHAAASVALFLVLWRMTGELWPSGLVAALFTVHPQHVESVAWVAERRDVLSGLFFMLTLAAYLGYVRHDRSLGRYLLTAAVFALGLMAKPMLVTLPALLLLLDFWPLARMGAAGDRPDWTRRLQRPGAGRLLLEKLPLVALAAGDCLMTLWTHPRGSLPLAWSERIGNAAVSCVSYVLQFFYPVDLAIFYPSPVGGPAGVKVAGAVAILSATSAAAVIWRRRCPYFFVGWFWYLGMLAPVLGLVTVSDHAMADRYMYLPGIGLCIALAWGAARLAAGSAAVRRVLGPCAALAIAVLMALAARQTSFWRDDETLWRHALACTSDNSKAELGVAKALRQQGQIDEAIAYCRQAQKHAVDSAPFNDLGELLVRQGRVDEAIAEFRQGLTIEPRSFLSYFNLGAACALQDRFDESEQYFRRALEIDPRGASAYNGLAHLLIFHGKIDEARVELQRALAVDPDDVAVRNDLASTYFQEGKIAQAIPQYEAALAIDPNSVLSHVNLASALVARGQIDEALAHFRRALELDPSNAVARAKLEKLLRADRRGIDHRSP